MRTEYYEPKTVPGEKPVPGILVDCEALYGLLLRAELMMNAVDRRRYAARAIDQILDVIRDFTLAHDFEEERAYWLRRMCADIAVFIRTIRIIGRCNAICIRPKYETMSPDAMKLEILGRVASLDEGATRWRKSLIRATKNGKGTTGGTDTGTGRDPKNKGDGTRGDPAS